MKKVWFILLPVCFLFIAMTGCEKEEGKEEKNPLAGTKWKLTGFTIGGTDMLRIPQLSNENCYLLYFNTNKTWNGRSSANDLSGDYEIDIKTSTIRIINLITTEVSETGDGKFYVNALQGARKFVLYDGELSLFCGENDCLIFNPVAAQECGYVEIQENEYVTMQVFPAKIPLNSANIHLLITNHTPKEILCEYNYSIERFNNNIWIPVYSYQEPTYIGLQPIPAEESIEISISLGIEQYTYTAGKYRINYGISANRNKYNVCAEFEIY